MMEPVPISSSSSSSSAVPSSSSSSWVTSDGHLRSFARGITLQSLQENVPDILLRKDITSIGRNKELVDAYIDTSFISSVHCVLTLFSPRDPRRIHAVQHPSGSSSSPLPLSLPLSESYLRLVASSSSSSSYAATSNSSTTPIDNDQHRPHDHHHHHQQPYPAATRNDTFLLYPPEYIGILHDVSSNGTWINNSKVQGNACDRYYNYGINAFLGDTCGKKKSKHRTVASSSFIATATEYAEEETKFLHILERMRRCTGRSVPVKYGDIIELTHPLSNPSASKLMNNSTNLTNHTDIPILRFRIQYTQSFPLSRSLGSPTDTVHTLSTSPISSSSFSATESSSVSSPPVSLYTPRNDPYRTFGMVASSTPTATLRNKGQFYQDYLVSKLLGEGTYGAVYEVISIVTGEYFACKVVYPKNMVIVGAGGGRTDHPALLEEIQILQSVRHPNIVSYFDLYKERTIPPLENRTKDPSGSTVSSVSTKVPRKDPAKESTEDIIFIIMEYVSNGEVFDKLLQEHRFPELQGKQLFKQLLRGITYLHSIGICHRDLKPENLLLHRYVYSDTMIKKESVSSSTVDPKEYRFILKITDFGMSRIITRKYIPLPVNDTSAASSSTPTSDVSIHNESRKNRLQDGEPTVYQERDITNPTEKNSTGSHYHPSTGSSSSSASSSKKLTRAKSIVGTADYIPPEVYIRWKAPDLNRKLITQHIEYSNEMLRSNEAHVRRQIRISNVRFKLQVLGERYPELFISSDNHEHSSNREEQQRYVDTYNTMNSSSSTQAASEEGYPHPVDGNVHRPHSSHTLTSSTALSSRVRIDDPYLDEWSSTVLDMLQHKETSIDLDTNTQLPDSFEPLVTLSSSSSSSLSTDNTTDDWAWLRDKHVLHCKSVDLVREYLPNDVIDYADSKEMELYFQRIGKGPVYHNFLLRMTGSTDTVMVKSSPERTQTLLNPYSVTWATDRTDQIDHLFMIDDYVKYGYNGFSMDSWSLGVILYVLLTGNAMFPESNHESNNENSTRGTRHPRITAQNIPSILQRMLLGYVEFQPFAVNEDGTVPEGSQLSNESKDLICSLCHLNPKQRLTPYQALQHPWILDKELTADNHPRYLPKYPIKETKKGNTNGTEEGEWVTRRDGETEEDEGRPHPTNTPPNVRVTSLSSTAEVHEDEDSFTVNPLQFRLPLPSKGITKDEVPVPTKKNERKRYHDEV